MSFEQQKPLKGWKQNLHTVIFEAETPGGKFFDVMLLWAIVISVIAVLLESVSGVREQYGVLLLRLEWAFTVLFTVEYFLRLLCVRHSLGYAKSFFGLVDLFSILPTYLSILFAGSQSLLVIRGLRLLRIFRVFKLVRFTSEARILLSALKASRVKITVFLGTVLTLVLILGAVMYLIEGEKSGFTSIPRSMYWAIVTLTTVGYGDITPRTLPGQMLASLVMILGYSIIAVPTGIVSVELAQATKRQTNTRSCPACSGEGHESDSSYCRFCGAKL